MECYKQHKTETCEPPQAANEDKESQGTTENQYFFPTEDTVPVDKLQRLRHNEEVVQCLRNPHVRDIMKTILNDKNPTAAIALAMTEPIFVELADACLKIVEKPDEDKPC